MADNLENVVWSEPQQTEGFACVLSTLNGNQATRDYSSLPSTSATFGAEKKSFDIWSVTGTKVVTSEEVRQMRVKNNKI